MKNIRILFCFVIIFASLFACTCTSTQISDEKVIDNKPKHHTSNGFQNQPFVETASSKGLFFYLRRVWGSIFLPDVPEGYVLPEQEALQLFYSIKEESITWLGHVTFLIKTAGKTILTDPLLSKFASPVSWTGPRRFVDLGIRLYPFPFKMPDFSLKKKRF